MSFARLEIRREQVLGFHSAGLCVKSDALYCVIFAVYYIGGGFGAC